MRTFIVSCYWRVEAENAAEALDAARGAPHREQIIDAGLCEHPLSQRLTDLEHGTCMDCGRLISDLGSSTSR